jgi:hypothetical protein
LGIDCSHGGSYHTPRGGGGGRHSNDLGDSIKKEVEKRLNPNAAINIGLNLLANSSPPIGALLTAYDLALRADEIAKVAEKVLKEYEESGSVTKAAMIAAPDVANMVLDEVKSRFVDSIVPGTDPGSQVVNNIFKTFM